MNTAILHTDVQDFIIKNEQEDLTKLILKGSPFKHVSVQELAQQIAAKQKAATKIPTWFATENCYYPPKINLEQTSSETTAKYKASLVSGNSLIDLTGGFGIDSWAFSKKFTQVTHCELNTELAVIAQHNFKQLGCTTISCTTGDSIAYLKSGTQKFDVIYVDPSRRNEAKGKVFLLKDCLPNVPEQLELFFEKAEQILIKNSPILDISNTISELKYVKEIHVVAVQNEVKELLFLLEKNYTGAIGIQSINYQKDTTQLFQFEFKTAVTATYSLPKTYLYEPNAAILKAGGFYAVSAQLQLDKLQQHAHLYTSDTLVAFPGRVFTITQVVSYDKKWLKKYIKKANITTRNFPESVASIRKKTGIKDGGTLYLFFTTNLENNLCVLVCTRL